VVSSSQLELVTRFFFCIDNRWFFLYGAPSLTRGWVYNLLIQLFLGLARAVTLGSESRRTHGHILLSHLRLPQPGEPGPRIYIPQEQGGPVIPPGTGFPFRRLLRLAGQRWRYSHPPPHGQGVKSCISLNITPSSPLEANRRFGTHSPSS
jgi:hypothetical protein